MVAVAPDVAAHLVLAAEGESARSGLPCPVAPTPTVAGGLAQALEDFEASHVCEPASGVRVGRKTGIPA